MGDYSWMRPEHAAICEAVAAIIGPQMPSLLGRPDTETDSVLSAAVERAGYSEDEGCCIEICAKCGAVFHTNYGHESVEPEDVAPLARELQVKRAVVKRLIYQHFCEFDHLRDAVWALEAA